MRKQTVSVSNFQLLHTVGWIFFSFYKKSNEKKIQGNLYISYCNCNSVTGPSVQFMRNILWLCLVYHYIQLPWLPMKKLSLSLSSYNLGVFCLESQQSKLRDTWLPNLGSRRQWGLFLTKEREKGKAQFSRKGVVNIFPSQKFQYLTNILCY